MRGTRSWARNAEARRRGRQRSRCKVLEAEIKPETEAVRVEVSGFEKAAGAGGAVGGFPLLKGLAFGDGAIDLVAGADDIAEIKEVIADRRAEPGRQRIAELELQFRDDGEALGGSLPFVRRLGEDAFRAAGVGTREVV